MSLPNPQDVSRILREAADREVLPRFRKLAAGDIQEKSGPSDLVTTADVEAERYLTRYLSELTPDAMIIGEEAVAADPLLTRHLTEDGAAWIIDPVDGTLNFAEGRPEFAIILCYVERGEMLGGWILAPLTGELIWAARGEGAWSSRVDGTAERLRVPDAAPVDRMRGALYAGPKRAPELHQRVKKIRKDIGKLSYFRSVGHEYLSLARGDNHYALFTRLMPWDHAAGVLIHAECGGFCRRLDGQPYSLAENRGFLLLAPDETTWTELSDLLLADGAATAPP